MRREGADVAQVAVALAVVEAVADDELVGDVPADVLRRRPASCSASGLRSRVQISTLAGLREVRLEISHDRVRPVSMISSTISTCRPVMSVSRSLRIRTTPLDLVPEPYDDTAIQSISTCRSKRAGEVGHHHHRAAQDADEQQVLARRSRPRSAAASSREPGLDLLLGEEDVDEVVLHVGRVHGRSLAVPARRAGPRGSAAVASERSASPREDQPPCGADVAGQVDPALAVPVGRRRASTARTCSWNSSAAGAPARERPRAGARGGGARSAAPVERRRRRGRRRPAASASAVVGEVVEERPCRRAAGRRCGPASRRRPGPSSLLEQRQHACAAPGTRVKRGSALCGSSQKSRPSTWQAVTVSARRTSSSGRRKSLEGAAHPGQRAAAGAAGQAEQHGLGLVVAGVAEQHGRGAEALGDLARARRTAPRGRPPRARARAAVDRAPARRRSRRRPAPPAARRPARPARPSRPAGRGRRSRRRPARPARGPRTTVAASSASESAPPEQATTTTSPGSRSASVRRTPSRTGGDGGVQAHRPPVSRGPGRPRRRGRRSRPWTAGCSGASQTALNSSMPTLSTTARTKTAPSRYCAILASRPSSRRSSRSSDADALAALVELACGSRATDGITVGPTPSMTTSAWPSSSDITPVTRSRISRCSGVLISVEQAAALARGAPRRPGRGRRRASRAGSTVSAMPLHLAEQVVAQPRDGGELHPVGLLVQAHPEPEVVRVDVELALDVDDVGRDQQQPAVPGRGTGRTGRAPCCRGSRAAAPTSAPVTREPTACGEPGGRASLLGELVDDRRQDASRSRRRWPAPSRPGRRRGPARCARAGRRGR